MPEAKANRAADAGTPAAKLNAPLDSRPVLTHYGRLWMVQVNLPLEALKLLRFVDCSFITVLSRLMPPMSPSNTTTPSSRVRMENLPEEHSSPGFSCIPHDTLRDKLRSRALLEAS